MVKVRICVPPLFAFGGWLAAFVDIPCFCCSYNLDFTNWLLERVGISPRPYTLMVKRRLLTCFV
jgi:hypothetical protein